MNRWTILLLRLVPGLQVPERNQLFEDLHALDGVDTVADAALVSRRTLDLMLYRPTRRRSPAVPPVEVEAHKRKGHKDGPKGGRKR